MAKAKHKGVNIATHNDGIIQQDLTKHLPEYLTEHLPEYLTDSDIQNLPEDLTEHLSEDLTEYLTKDLTDADIRKWPIAYIVSRLRGKSEQEYHDNMKAAEHFCRVAMEHCRNPFASHLFYTRFLRDGDAEERRLGTNLGIGMIRAAAEVWVFPNGKDISEGMRQEIAEAERIGIPVVYRDEVFDAKE